MKDLKISEELLSEILHAEIIDVEKNLRGNCLRYCWNDRAMAITQEINIYELAHLCKEWMATQGYGIKTETYDYMEDDSFSGTYWSIIKLRAKNWKDRGCPNCGANATEIEAIIQACEWILKEVNK